MSHKLKFQFIINIFRKERKLKMSTKTMRQIVAEETMRADMEKAKAQARLEYEATVHRSKLDKSAAMFKNTKVTSCSSILQKSG